MSTRQRRTLGSIPCTFAGCARMFYNQSGLTQHVNSQHYTIEQPLPLPPAANEDIYNFDNGFSSSPPRSRGPTPSPSRGPTPSPPHSSSPSPNREPSPNADHANKRRRQVFGTKHYHPYLTGDPCDKDGNPLPPDTPPPPPPPTPANAWAPFDDEIQFRVSEFLFRKVEMSQGDIDHLMELWDLSMQQHGGCAPFGDHDKMYAGIDDIPLGSAPWKCFVAPPPPDLPTNAPEWKKQSYQIWYRDPDTVISNMLANPDFASEFDASPYVHIGPNGKRRWSEFMSGNFSYNYAVRCSPLFFIQL